VLVGVASVVQLARGELQIADLVEADAEVALIVGVAGILVASFLMISRERW